MLAKDPSNIRLGMIGMVDENGHPFSWSAIVNGGFDREEMANCGYPVIPQYLGAAQAAGKLGIPGARVTHVWTEDPADARRVAKASLIPNIVGKAEDVIGRVDAVLIPTDKGWEHLDRARPFVEANVPVFIDKPMTDVPEHLQQFVAWRRAGKPIMSSSCMRYSVEFAALRQRMSEIGELRMITIATAKSWRRYGIHALEGVYPFLPPGGWTSACNTGTDKAAIVHARHQQGVDVIVAAVQDMYGGFGCLNLYGTQGHLSTKFADTFTAFKAQLDDFVNYLRTGQSSYPFGETVELMKLVIAGVVSQQQGGRWVELSEFQVN